MARNTIILKRCPVCDSSKIKQIVEDRVYFHKHKKIEIPNVPREKCFSCGEQFFGPDSYDVINAYRNKKKVAVG